MTPHSGRQGTAPVTPRSGPTPTRAECIDRAAQALVDDLAAQAARTPRDAAHAAGCRTDTQIADWIAAHRPDPLARGA